MSDILFVYPNISGYEGVSLGIAYLSSYLKKHGYSTQLFDYTFYKDSDKGTSVLLDMIKKEKPSLIGFSVISSTFSFAAKTAELIKKEFDVNIVFGGPHATAAPEAVMKRVNDCFVIVNEGEEPLIKLISAIKEGKAPENIEGVCYSNGGEEIKNNIGIPIQDLDNIPFPDRGIYDFDKYVKSNSGTIVLLTGRGCPFECSYCINPLLQKQLENKGKFIRRHSVDYVLDEVTSLKEQYEFKYIDFADDTFTLSKSWMGEFAKKYKKRFNIPYLANARVENIDEEMIALLKESNCNQVSMGIESGTEEIRKDLLKRRMSDDKIIKSFNLLRKAGIKTISYNIIGLPTERPEHWMKTVQLNREANPDYISASIFQPYPGTGLYDLCKSKGWFNDEECPVHHRGSEIVVDYDYVTQAEIVKFKRRFRYLVYKKKDFFKALIFLLLDTNYNMYFRIRRGIPIPIKKFLRILVNLIKR